MAPFLLADVILCTLQVLYTIPQVWVGRRLNWNMRAEERARRGNQITARPGGEVADDRCLQVHRAAIQYR